MERKIFLTKNQIEPPNEYQTMDDRNRKIMSFVGFALRSKIRRFLLVVCVLRLSASRKSTTSVFHVFASFE